METPCYAVEDIANYFLFKAESEEERITNLKLQKLIYYAQGLYLVLNKKPLHNGTVKAWKYGPVIPEIYFMYKDHGASGIPKDDNFTPNAIDADTKEFLDEIYTVFGQFSAGRLMEIAHSDQCWIDAFPDRIISHEAMETCLRKYLKDGEE